MAKGKHTRRTVAQRTKINVENLAPAIAEGMTFGVPKAEALAESPSKEGSVVRHMSEHESVGRVPLPRFVGEDRAGMVTTFADGREFRDKTLIFQPEVMRSFQAGMICLRCLEPQSHAFADEHLPGCEGVALVGARYMRDRQIMDYAMEFDGERHLGPSRPINEYLDELEAVAEKRAFDRKIAEGRSPMKGLTHG